MLPALASTLSTIGFALSSIVFASPVFVLSESMTGMAAVPTRSKVSSEVKFGAALTPVVYALTLEQVFVFRQNSVRR
jgi:hypothetical protein